MEVALTSIVSPLQRELYGGTSLDAVRKAAGVTEDLQLGRLFSILQVGKPALSRARSQLFLVPQLHPSFHSTRRKVSS